VSLRTLFFTLSVLLLGLTLSFISGRRRSFRLPHPLMNPSYSQTWEKLPQKRRDAIANNHKRFSGMTPKQQRLIRDRWQFYRHLPPWRQEQMLRELQAWQKMNPRP
jgi:hypothetical protein